MPNKKTNWITIPEEKVHTPVSKTSGKKEKDSGGNMRNKLFWGIGFVVMAIAVFAVLAPTQFNTLLRGSLFDAEGVDTPVASPEDLLSPNQQEGEDSEENEEEGGVSDEEMPAEADEEPPEENYVEEPVVQPEEEAVDISVEPVSEPEEEGPEDCGTDLSCFLPHLEDCSLAKMAYESEILEKGFEADHEITGSENDDCLMNVLYTTVTIPQMAQKEAVCKLEKGTYDEDQFVTLYENTDEFLEKCSGPAVEALEAYLAGLAEEEGAQAELIDELNKQLEELQKQREEDIKAMEELAEAAEGMKPAAPGTVPGVDTTAAIGQPSAVQQPGFRVNPHTVTTTPEAMLRQNQASGYQVAQAVPQPTAQVTTPEAVRTPDSGPSEVMFIAFLLTFVSLLGWKLLRLSLV